MAKPAPELPELLARADALRAAGQGAEAARAYDEAATTARAADDHDAWARAVLGAASVQVFGAEPGRLPALLYDVLARTTDDALRSRLAAALARCWVYAGEAERGSQFSEEALARARLVPEDPAVLADALDAALAVHWGPDELDLRRELAGELAEVAAHLTDPEARLQAHLWGLHVATETLDVQVMHRQMRALELVGEDSPKALFFAASRRLMLDLMRGRTDTTDRLCEIAAAAAEEAFLADSFMVLSAMRAYSAIQSGDVEGLVAMAVVAEEFALTEGSSVVTAEAGYCWAFAGHLDRARSLTATFHGGRLEALPRDQDWLLTLQLLLEVALAIEDVELVTEAAGLLAPYAGRAVVNGGAVAFHGTTDDTLSRAFAVLGRNEEAAQLRARALKTYERIGAQWWRARLEASGPAPAAGPSAQQRQVALHPVAGGLWRVGPTVVADLRGLGYLRELVGRPGTEVTALDLIGTRGPVLEESGLGEVADRQALAAYRQRLADLDVELAEAEDWADAGRAERAREERDALLEELARATGLGGRPRTSGSSQERARVAVKKAISTAIGRIAEVDGALALHLRNSIRTGLACSYQPEPGSAPVWLLDEPRSSGSV